MSLWRRTDCSGSIRLSAESTIIQTGICNFAYAPCRLTTLGIISAASAAPARIWDGRTAISFGKPANFGGTEFGPKSLRIKSGHVSLLRIGDSVYLRKSPSTGTDGADKIRVSARTVG